jgi:Tubulin like
MRNHAPTNHQSLSVIINSDGIAINGDGVHYGRGKRYHNLYIGGGLQAAGLALRVDDSTEVQAARLRIAFADTDSNNLDALPKAEKFIMDQVRAADLLAAIAEHPERFPGAELLGDLDHKWRALGTAESLPAGLMTRRELGPLVLKHYLWRAPAALRTFLLQAGRELHQQMRQTCWRYGNEFQRPLSLTITYGCSSCGGTGSSQLVLLADLHRHFLRTDEGFKQVHFVADILLPGPMLHRAIDPEALKANTYAFFLELLARYERQFASLQMGSHRVSRAHRPFAQLYLYDETNLHGRVFTTREEINDMVYVVWKLRNLGPEGQEYQARLVDYHLEYPNIFSAAGACILVFPAEAIITECSLRSGAAWIWDQPLHVMLTETVNKQADEAVNNLKQRHPGLREVSRFTRDEANKPLEIQLSGMKHYSRKQIPQAVETALQMQLMEIGQTLSQLGKKEVAHLSAALIIELQQLLNRQGGVPFAQQVWRRLQTHLTEQKQQLEKQSERARTERERSEEQIIRWQSVPWWRRVTLQPRRAYLARFRRLSQNQIQELRQATRLQVVLQLLEFVEQLMEECEAWNKTLSNLADLLEEELHRFRAHTEANRSVAEEVVVCPDEINQMYQADKEQALNKVQQGLRFTWQPLESKFSLLYSSEEPTGVDRWSIVSGTGVAQHTNYFRRFWQHIQEHSVEEILTKQGKTPEEVLAQLEYSAAPLVSVDDTKQLPAEKTLNILASQTRIFWKDFVGQTGLSIVATGNKHRISLLSTVHGLNPLEGMMQTPAWRQAYTDSVAAGRSPHVFPELEWPEQATAVPSVNGHSASKPAVAEKENNDESIAQ